MVHHAIVFPSCGVDGLDNQAEFAAGTSPTDSTSGARIISTATQRNDIVITWNDHWRPTNLVQAPAGDDNGGCATNFTDVNSMIIIKGRGDQTTNDG